MKLKITLSAITLFLLQPLTVAAETPVEPNPSPRPLDKLAETFKQATANGTFFRDNPIYYS